MDILNLRAAIGINVYKEVRSLRRCLRYARRSYPCAPIVCLTDGDDDDDYTAICDASGATLIRGTRLRPTPTGGLWWQRLLREWLTIDVAYYLRIDPDTRLLRPFPIIPKADVMGQFYRVTSEHEDRLVLLGGCLGFTRKAVERIAESRILERPGWADKRYSLHWEDRADNLPLSYADRIINEAIIELGLRRATLPGVELGIRQATPRRAWKYRCAVSVEESQHPQMIKRYAKNGN